jgi:hypothetical protein
MSLHLIKQSSINKDVCSSKPQLQALDPGEWLVSYEENARTEKNFMIRNFTTIKDLPYCLLVVFQRRTRDANPLKSRVPFLLPEHLFLAGRK